MEVEERIIRLEIKYIVPKKKPDAIKPDAIKTETFSIKKLIILD
jgi:hypothetical protein